MGVTRYAPCTTRPLSSELKDRIYYGGDVAFGDILRELSLGAPSTVATKDRALSQSNYQSSRKQVDKLVSWLQAWAAYAATAAEYYPSRARELPAYQARFYRAFQDRIRNEAEASKGEQDKRNGIPICINRGKCTQPSICRYRHVCSKVRCGDNHPYTSCGKAAATQTATSGPS